jgi:S-adenosylmethionine synthetase
VVAADLADRCEVQLSYAIGVAEPLSVRVETFGTNKVDEDAISAAVTSVFDLRPDGIISALGLKSPIFERTAYHGHFGRDEFSWENTNKTAELKDAVAAKA